MDKSVRFLSIGTKIYSIAIGLIVLMIGVSGVSAYMVDLVRDELQLQSNIFLPLSNRIAGIETTILDGEVLIERMRHALDEGRTQTSAAEIQQELAHVATRADEQFQRAYAILESVDFRTLDTEAAIAATRVETTLRAIELEYRDYRSGLEKLLSAQQSGSVSEMRLLNDLLIEEEQEIYHHLERIRAEMQDYVAKSVRHIVELDLILDRLILVVTGLAALLGLLLSGLVTRKIISPMRELVAGLKRVEDGDLETELAVTTTDETARLAHGFNEMIAGLRAKERITETFGRYVDPRVVENLIGNPALSKPGGDRRDMTVQFTDMSGFTTLSERLSPDSLVNLLNAYFTEMANPIQEHSGVIDKYIGDAIMAYWGPPFTDPAHQAEQAIDSALEQLELILAFNKRVPEILGVKLDGVHIDLRIGIASGSALVGTVGSTNHHNYTVMGDTVNVASRLEGACKEYRLRLLVDERTRKETDKFLFREIDMLRVKGRAEPLHVSQPICRLPASPDRVALAKTFEQGLKLYQARKFEAALKSFKECLEIYPDDGPSKVFVERSGTLLVAPPPDDWDGVWTMMSK